MSWVDLVGLILLHGLSATVYLVICESKKKSQQDAFFSLFFLYSSEDLENDLWSLPDFSFLAGCCLLTQGGKVSMHDGL